VDEARLEWSLATDLSVVPTTEAWSYTARNDTPTFGPAGDAGVADRIGAHDLP
jgi:hypothetical protein